MVEPEPALCLVNDAEQRGGEDESTRARHGEQIAQVVGADIQLIRCPCANGNTLCAVRTAGLSAAAVTLCL